MRKKWVLFPVPGNLNDLSVKHRLHPVTVQVLLNRGVEEKDFEVFLNPGFSALHPPGHLPDIDRAVSRIKKAISRREKIFVFGDYDVDGVTSLAIFHEYMKKFPLDIDFHIPHRVKEGYGLNKEAIIKARDRGAGLLICFDCGTNSHEEISLAKEFGIDVIVVDHHSPKPGHNLLPHAFVNPKREDFDYPFPDLSGAGLAFKLVWALDGTPQTGLLDMVAMSIVCDVVPLRGENRILLREGIEHIKNGSRPGISALCKAARVNPGKIDSYHIGYILGPRVNACGRVSSAHEAFQLFVSTEAGESLDSLAARIDRYNRDRQSIERKVLKEAEEIIERELIDDSAFVLFKENWHPGVLGIVASRIADKYGRPAFVLGMEKGQGKGSARSVPGVHILEVLDECKDSLHSYGGHQKAAGIQILPDRIDEFRDRLNHVVHKTMRGREAGPKVMIDAELSLNIISMEVAAQLEKLKPFGEKNTQPLFLTRSLTPRTKPKKIAPGLSSFWISDGVYTYEASFYERDGFSDMIAYGSPVDVVYSLGINSYHSVPKLFIKDLRMV